ncbi:hypothetical protein [Alteromonas sp. CYL-A6]|uniref:hypothetical protein n=1 Tax=Alteromonas nitratireducens TaxID=3390813 RepID=UPI0034AB2D33
MIYLLNPSLIELSDPWHGDPYSFTHVFGLVVVVVLIENILVTGLAELIKKTGIHNLATVLVIALLAGALHAVQAFAWFFPAFLSFFVLTFSYLLWRSVNKRTAFGVIFIIHSVNNLLAISPYYLFAEQSWL